MPTGRAFLKLGPSRIAKTALICHGAVIGKPYRPLQDAQTEIAAITTVVGRNTYVGYYATVGAGSVLAPQVVVDDYCSIESEVAIGERTLVIYRAQVCNEASVGRDCIIGGFVAERARIGDKVRVFGKLVHSQRNPTLSWDSDEAEEESPVIESGAFIGFDSMVIGKVTVGSMAYVCAGAIVTKDVPARHIAFSVNKIVPYSEWKGTLANSQHFAGGDS